VRIINFEDKETFGTDEDALTTSTSGELLINFGDLTTTGDLANGIFAGANDVTVGNFADIETSGLGAAGIYVSGENARIENFGSVTTTGTFTDDQLFFAEGIFAEGNGFYIANYGSVQIEGESSSALVGAGEDGLTINYGVAESSAASSAVIAAFGDRSQAINRGQVTSSGAATGAMVVAGEDASALNLGEILITGEASNGMAGDANTHLTNRGEIRFELDDDFGDPSFGMISIVGGSQISNFGLIEMHGAFAVGISALGRIPLGELGLDFEIFNAGRVTTDGDLAIGVALGLGRFGFANAAQGQIENSGVIKTVGDGAAGVLMIGEDHQLTNSGRITTDGGTFTDPDSPVGELHAAGVIVTGDDALVVNTSTGVITSRDVDSAAIELNVLERGGLTNADTSATLENSGLIEGALAVLCGDGKETVINHGRIVGDVDLGDGEDTFHFGNGGTVVGKVFLGDGDDHVVIDNGSGKTVIADFVAGGTSGDQIDVSEFFSSFVEVTAHSQQRGSNVVINLDNNDTLVLSNVQLSALTDGDFLLV
jgi:hypothetical protein